MTSLHQIRRDLRAHGPLGCGSSPRWADGSALQRTLRSTHTKYYLETLVVADHSMLQEHGCDDLKAYLYTLMNVVSLAVVLDCAVGCTFISSTTAVKNVMRVSG